MMYFLVDALALGLGVDPGNRTSGADLVQSVVRMRPVAGKRDSTRPLLESAEPARDSYAGTYIC